VHNAALPCEAESSPLLPGRLNFITLLCLLTYLLTGGSRREQQPLLNPLTTTERQNAYITASKIAHRSSKVHKILKYQYVFYPINVKIILFLTEHG
jgi:hypothetical protein